MFLSDMYPTKRNQIFSFIHNGEIKGVNFLRIDAQKDDRYKIGNYM